MKRDFQVLTPPSAPPPPHTQTHAHTGARTYPHCTHPHCTHTHTHTHTHTLRTHTQNVDDSIKTGLAEMCTKVCVFFGGD
jgi:hypothetical protein